MSIGCGSTTPLAALLLLVLCPSPAFARLFGEWTSNVWMSIEDEGNPAQTNFPRTEKDAMIPNQHVLFFSNDTEVEEVEEKAAEVARQTGGKILWIYKDLKGVALSGGRSLQRRALQDSALLRDSVESFEQDQIMVLDEMQTTRPLQNNPNIKDSARSLQTVQLDRVPRGLDRIDQVSRPLDGQYRHILNGAGVTVFVMDSGLLTSHSEFDGQNAGCGFDAYNPVEDENDNGNVPDDDDVPPQRHCIDSVNHGTHVAGTVGGRISGVAKNATIVSVTVSDRDGRATRASFLAGLDYILGRKRQNPSAPMVVNISIGSFFSPSLNRRLNELVDAGVVVVASAGNRGINACLFSPASATKIITVGATAYSSLFGRDRRSLYSNHGRCVDIFAPGNKIVSASAESEIDFYLNSGTSMAAPHVAGAAALYLQRDPTMTPAQVRDALLRDASTGQVMRLFNWRSPDRLLYTGNI